MRARQARLLVRLVAFRVQMSPRRRGSRYHENRGGFWRMWLTANRAHPPAATGGDVSAVVLVHRRPANLDLQLRLLLAAPSVGRVVVSSNNPQVDLAAWTTISDDRLSLRTDLGVNQIRRYTIAASMDAELFVMLDDDIFIEPAQLERMFSSFREDPTNPLGLMGQVIGSDGTWDGAITATGAGIDVLNRMYICSATHVAQVSVNAAVLGWSMSEAAQKPADDVLISFGGPGRPRLLETPFVDCLSHNDRSIATFQQKGFHEARFGWVDTLRRAGRARSGADA